jgi:hypothetical protein
MAIATAGTKVNEIAVSLGLTEGELFQQALVSFLLEKKRRTLQLKLEILARYGADSIADLESKIAQGVVVEHPAWEDLIVAENLDARLRELNDHLDDLRSPESDRPQ